MHAGVGALLLDHPLADAPASGVWTVQSGVFPQNTASFALHAAAGLRVVGSGERPERIDHGPHAGTWLNVVLLVKRL